MAVHLVGGAAIEFEIAGGGVDIGFGLRHRLAGVARFELGQFLGMVLDLEAQFRDQAAALGRGQPAPGAFESSPCRRDRRIDIGGIAAGDAGEFLARGGSELGNRLAGLAGDVAAVDEVLVHGPCLSPPAAACQGGVQWPSLREERVSSERLQRESAKQISQ